MENIAAKASQRSHYRFIVLVGFLGMQRVLEHKIRGTKIRISQSFHASTVKWSTTSVMEKSLLLCFSNIQQS